QLEIQLAQAISWCQVGQAAETERGAQHREQGGRQGVDVELGEKFGGGFPAAPPDLRGQVGGGGVDAFEDSVHEGAEFGSVGQVVHQRRRGGRVGRELDECGGGGFVAGAARILGLGVDGQFVGAFGERRVGRAPPLQVQRAIEAGGGQ